ncbi:SRPBCC family protein [Aquirufa salirivi]|uniref:Ligand-binding SRPBCC domain-containing protein n=1 Tax=Aquirufa salirivi TaxID=3104729 RepID=A0ABW8RWS4_9BACT
MPSFRVQTPINSPIEYVWALFDKDLLSKLSPPFPPVSIKRFDGCRKGDLVQLEIKLGLFSLYWDSEITEDFQSDDKIYFIDEGRRIPLGMNYWKHEHILEKLPNNQTLVIDQISYSTSSKFLDILLYPLLWGMIAYRKPFYKSLLTLR